MIGRTFNLPHQVAKRIDIAAWIARDDEDARDALKARGYTWNGTSWGARLRPETVVAELAWLTDNGFAMRPVSSLTEGADLLEFYGAEAVSALCDDALAARYDGRGDTFSIAAVDETPVTVRRDGNRFHLAVAG